MCHLYMLHFFMYMSFIRLISHNVYLVYYPHVYITCHSICVNPCSLVYVPHPEHFPYPFHIWGYYIYFGLVQLLLFTLGGLTISDNTNC